MKEKVMSDLKVEKEFDRFTLLHKRAVIEIALIYFEDEGIYEVYPFTEFKDVAEGEDKPFIISKRLLKDSFEGEKEKAMFESAYVYSWERVKNKLDDSFNATRRLIGGDYIEFKE